MHERGAAEAIASGQAGNVRRIDSGEYRSSYRHACPDRGQLLFLCVIDEQAGAKFVIIVGNGPPSPPSIPFTRNRCVSAIAS